MKLSWNFKFALGTIAVVTAVCCGIFMYASQLMGDNNLAQQMDFYQLMGFKQARILHKKINTVQVEVQQPAATTSVVSVTSTMATTTLKK